MNKYLLTRSNLLNNHLSMAGITQQAPDVAVWDVLNGYPFSVVSDGVFNWFELHHDRTPVQIHWCTKTIPRGETRLAVVRISCHLAADNFGTVLTGTAIQAVPFAVVITLALRTVPVGLPHYR